MTVKREIGELEQRMKNTIGLFRKVYNGDRSELHVMRELEGEVAALRWDLTAVLSNLKAI